MKRNVSNNAIQDATKLLARNVDLSVVQEFIKLRDGVEMNPNSLKKLRQVVLMNEDGGEANDTAAQKLLRFLNKTEHYNWVAYFGSYTEATKTVSLRKESKRGKKSKVVKSNKNPSPKKDGIDLKVREDDTVCK